MCEQETGWEFNASASHWAPPSALGWRSKMDKKGKKPKSYISTLRLVFKPETKGVCAGRQEKDGLDANKRTLMGSNTLVVSSASGKDQQNTEKG